MKDILDHIVKSSIEVKRKAFIDNEQAIIGSVLAIEEAIRNSKKLMICGNGGSAADSQHIAAEFVGRFQKERCALPALALTTDTSIITALANDYTADIVFARQVEALGNTGDVLWAISTSGNSPNVVRAVEAARSKGIKVITMTGKDGGKLKSMGDFNIHVDCPVTARAQESHITISHAICELVEERFC
jgi:D-sedoheptulose 7-phosphate isomerase